MKKKVSLSWSGGKDAAFALYKILQSEKYELHSLHTTFDSKLKRVGLHGIHEDLILKQAESIGLPLHRLYLQASQSHDAYEKMMLEYLEKLKSVGVEAIVFGDIFLADLKEYREKMLAQVGLEAIFPLWGQSTDKVLQEILHAGIKTTVCAADKALLGEDFVGKQLDDELIRSMPEGVDPCGENGEFHTFVTDAPYFNFPLEVEKGQLIEKRYYYKLLDQDGKEQKVEKIFYFISINL